MATVQGPLLSLKASGMIQKSILYRRINKRNVVSWNVGNPKRSTPARDAYACLMSCARAQWRTLTGEQRETWEQLALARPHVSGYNLYIKEWFAAHSFGSIPIFGCTPFDWSIFVSSGSGPLFPFFDLFYFDDMSFN